MSKEELDIIVSLNNQIKTLVLAINSMTDTMYQTLGPDGLGSDIEQLREAVKGLTASNAKD